MVIFVLEKDIYDEKRKSIEKRYDTSENKESSRRDYSTTSKTNCSSCLTYITTNWIFTPFGTWQTMNSIKINNFFWMISLKGTLNWSNLLVWICVCCVDLDLIARRTIRCKIDCITTIDSNSKCNNCQNLIKI